MKQALIASLCIIITFTFIPLSIKAKSNLTQPDSITALPDSLTSNNDSIMIFLRAKLFYHSQNFENAIKYFKLFINQNPEHPLLPLALYSLGEIYSKIDRIEDANSTYSRLSWNFPNNPYAIRALKNCGDLYFTQEDFDRAKRCYWNFVYFNAPRKLKDEAFFQIERCNYYLGIYDNPTEIYQNFIKKFPHSQKSPQLTYKLAKYYMEVENYKDALENFKILLSTYSQSVPTDSIYFDMATAFYRRGNFCSSIDTTISFLKNFPNSELKNSALQNLQNSFLQFENKLEAIKKLNLLIETVPYKKRNNYYKILAKLYQDLGFYQQVISIYNLMIHNTEKEEDTETLKRELKKIIRKTGHKNAIIDSLDSNKKSETLDIYDIYYE